MVAIKALFYFCFMEGKKALSIKTVPVEIRVLTVDGKRMTKSVFNQITSNFNGHGIVECSDRFEQFTVLVDVLGWVYSGIEGDASGQHKHLIYAKNGILYKVWFHDLMDGLKGQSLVDSLECYLENISTAMKNLFCPQNQIFISI